MGIKKLITKGKIVFIYDQIHTTIVLREMYIYGLRPVTRAES